MESSQNEIENENLIDAENENLIDVEIDICFKGRICMMKFW